eukprot:Sspe_Gene.13089::Locus_4494_Transcript_1_1_Confidence_1.000_Length_6114::g.13089::m.13089
MGQGHSIGKLGAKGQVAPVPAPGAHPPSSHRGNQNTAPVIGKSFPTYFYTTLLVSYPVTCLSISLVLPFCFTILYLFDEDSGDFDKTLEGFEVSEHDVVKRRDAVLAAVDDWKEVSERYPQQTPTTWSDFVDNVNGGGSEQLLQSIPWKRINLIYEVVLPDFIKIEECNRSSTVYSEWNAIRKREFLEFYEAVEQRIRRVPGFERVCFRSKNRAGVANEDAPCVPLTSIAQYYFPGEVVHQTFGSPTAGTTHTRLFWNFRYYEGEPMQEPVDRVLDMFFQNPNWRWYVDQRTSNTVRQSSVVRAQLTIGRPIGKDDRDAAKKLNHFVRLLMAFLNPFVEETKDGRAGPDGPRLLNGKTAPEGIRIIYGGDGIAESLVDEARDSDLWFVRLAMFLVTLLIGLYCHSCFIALCAILQTGMCYSTAAYIFTSSRDEELSLFTLLAFFIIVSMSVNGVFVFFNTFRQSAFMETTGRRNTLNVPQRMAFCFRKAGVGIVITHLTAGVAFVCNAVSPIPAVRGFGIFMLILICVNIYLFLTMFPCVIIFHHFYISKRRRNAQRQKEVLLRWKKRTGHAPVLRDAFRTLERTCSMSNTQPPLFIGHFRPVSNETVEGQVNVESGPMVSRFAGIIGRFRRENVPPPKPKSDDTKRQEDAEAFEMKRSGGPKHTSRRKQLPYSILHIPAPMTCQYVRSRADLFPEQAVRGALRGLDAPPEEPVDPADVNQCWGLHLSYWEEATKQIGLETVFGRNKFIDPDHPEKPLEAYRRSHMLSKVLHESSTLRVPRPLSRSPTLCASDDPREEAQLNSEGNAAGDGVVVAAAATGNGRPAGPTDSREGNAPILGNAPLQQEDDEDGGCCPWMTAISRWWEKRGQVKRRFGRFGKRVGETREEKDRRIMSKRSKHEAFTVLERAFYNYYTPVLRETHPFILIVYLAILIAFSIEYVAFLEPMANPPRLLETSLLEDYKEAQRKFPVEGSCDFCGLYFRPFDDFPPPFGRGSATGTKSEAAKEAWVSCGKQMFNVMDECGVCGGNNDCLDCMGHPRECILEEEACKLQQASLRCVWNAAEGKCQDAGKACPDDVNARYFANWEYDECGSCVLKTEPGTTQNIRPLGSPSCLRITSGIAKTAAECNDGCYARWPPPQGCSACDKKGFTNFYPAPRDDKPMCNIQCSSHTCYNGYCDPYSGECVCYSDPKRGYWDHEGFGFNLSLGTSGDCKICLEGFYPSAELKRVDSFWKDIPLCTSECHSEHEKTGECGCQCTQRVGCKCTVCEGTNGTAGPRPPHPDAKSDSVAIGLNCVSKNRSLCEFGTVNATTGECTCDDGWGGHGCQMHKACNLRGRLDVATNTVCECYGCWTGKNCEETICKNGGTCAEWGSEGSGMMAWGCECLGSWEGLDCSECPSTCRERGRCPLPWPATNYPGFLDPVSGRPVDKRYYECWGSSDGQCNGHWSGAKCEVCDPPAGVPDFLRDSVACTPEGKILGCDGLDATDTTFKWRDNCGVCTGVNDPSSVQCSGCDGIKGSNKVVDQCGVCGGFNECECASGSDRKRIRIELVWGIIPDNKRTIESREYQSTHNDPTKVGARVRFDDEFDFPNTRTQIHLHWVCKELMKTDYSFLIDPAHSDCLLLEFSNYVMRSKLVLEPDAHGNYLPKGVRACPAGNCNNNPSRLTESEVFITLRFPITQAEYVNFILYCFMEDTQKTHLLGFNTPNKYAKDLKLNWVRMQFTLRVYDDLSTEMGERNYTRWQGIVNAINRERTKAGNEVLGTCFQWSDTWIRVKTEEQFEKGTAYAIGMASVAFVVIVLLFTCSPTLTVLSGAALAGTILFVISCMRIAAWELGPAEQVGLSCMMGIAVDGIIHFTEGYMEYLHSTQSGLLARETTREQSLAGTLQRTGVPLLVATCTVIVASLCILGSEILIYRKIGEIMLLNIFFSAFHALVVFTCLLIMMGPTTIQRGWQVRSMLLLVVIMVGAFVVIILYLSNEAEDPKGDPLFG